MRSLAYGALVAGLLACSSAPEPETDGSCGRGSSAPGDDGEASGGVDTAPGTTTPTAGPAPESDSTDGDVTSGEVTSGELTSDSASTGGADTSPPGVQPWAVGTDIRISVWPDASAAWFDGLEARLQSASDLLWTATEGQHYVARVSVRDQETAAYGSGGIHFHIENLDRDYVDSQPGVYGYWDGALSIHLGGAFQTFTFVHEWGHVAYGLPDEYGPQCGQCMMASTAWTYCDDASHNPASHPVPCWTLILDRFPEWNYPNSEHGPAPPPIDVVEIVDN